MSDKPDSRTRLLALLASVTRLRGHDGEPTILAREAAALMPFVERMKTDG